MADSVFGRIAQHRQDEFGYQQKGRAASLECRIEKEEPPMRTLRETFSCIGVERDDVVQAVISDPNLGELDRSAAPFSEMIPAAARNVLMAAFQLFCPSAIFRSGLLQPHSYQAKRNKKSDAFERHVAWLLALAGVPTIVLAEHENLVVGETGIHRGTLDILGYRHATRTLFVIGCKLSVPKEEELSKVLNIRSILMNEVFNDLHVEVQAIIFSGAASCAQYRTSMTGDAFVSVIDASTLGTLVKLLEDGQEHRFFELLLNPVPNAGANSNFGAGADEYFPC